MKGFMGRFGDEIRGWERPKLFPLKFRYSDDMETIEEFNWTFAFFNLRVLDLRLEINECFSR